MPDRGHLFVSDVDFFGIAARVQDAAHLQSCGCSRVGEEIHNRGVGQQRLPAPVLVDEREQPMLDLVPLACSGRQVTHMNGQ